MKNATGPQVMIFLLPVVAIPVMFVDAMLFPKKFGYFTICFSILYTAACLLWDKLRKR